MSGLTKLEEDPRLQALDALSSPIWLIPEQGTRIMWGNQAAIRFWGVTSKEELIEERTYNAGATTISRIKLAQELVKQGVRTSEQWTLYPHGQPVSCNVTTSPFTLSDSTVCAIVEVDPHAQHANTQELLRGMEVLRHTSAMISVYSEMGHLIMHNPAASTAFGQQRRLEQRFEDPSEVLTIMSSLQRTRTHKTSALAKTQEGVRRHNIEIRLTRDPMSGQTIMLVHAHDVEDETHAHDVEADMMEVFGKTMRPILDALSAQTPVQEKHLEQAHLFMELMHSVRRGRALKDENLEVVDLLELVKETVSACAQPPERFQTKVVLRESSLPQDAVWEVRMDRALLGEALEALLLFGARTGGSEECLLVEVHEHADMYRVHVISHGVGIPESWRTSILNPSADVPVHVAGHDFLSRLGVYTAYIILHAHHGWVDFITSKDQGTDFFFDLPHANS